MSKNIAPNRDSMIISDDLSVGIDAFIERDMQILASIHFVHNYADPFVITAERRRYFEQNEPKRRYRDRPIERVWEDYSILGYLDSVTPAMPTNGVRSVMSVYERGTSNRYVWYWLARSEKDDDLTIRGIGAMEQRTWGMNFTPYDSSYP